MFEVNTLGKFKITNNETVLSEDNIHSGMLTKLLIFLIIYRKQNVTIDEIAEALWQEEEVDNPVGALKNLVYRLRNLLKKYFPESDCILTAAGSYCWNPQLSVAIDIEEFEQRYEMAKKEQSVTDAIHLYESAISLYKGDFMSRFTEKHWVVPLNIYYHSMYLSSVKCVSELYIQTKNYDQMENVCHNALRYDRLDELIYYYLIFARMKNHKWKLAMESYEKACKVLENELGIRNSKKLQEIYNELIQADTGNTVVDIDQIKDEVMEENPQGAFFCSYPVFCEICRLEARKSTRTEETAHVLLIVVEPDKSIKGDNVKTRQYRMRQAMRYMEETLKLSLRMGDVAAKYNDSGFIVLLPYCFYESSLMVAERIVAKFYERYSQCIRIKIQTSLDEVSGRKGKGVLYEA